MKKVYFELNDDDFTKILGGKRIPTSKGIGNVAGVVTAGAAGFASGTAICGPLCGIYGAHASVALWTAVNGATGGF